MNSFRKAPSRRNARIANSSLNGGVILSFVSMVTGPDLTVVTLRALSSDCVVVGSTNAADIGEWIMTGYSGADIEVTSASEITAGIADGAGLQFDLRFPIEFDELQVWSLTAPRNQSCIRGNNGGSISGIVFQGEPITPSNAGQIPVIVTGGQPTPPKVASFILAAVSAPTVIQLIVSSADGTTVDWNIFGVPAWLVNGGNAAINATSPSTGEILVEFADPVGAHPQVIVPPWDPAIRSVVGEWLPPLRINL